MVLRNSLLTCIAAAAALACATSTQRSSFVVEVDSLADTTLSDKRLYALFPGVEGVSPSDLQFREFATYVRKALNSQGLVEATDASAAEIAVFMNYGIGEPQTTQYTYSYPIYGMTGGGTSTFRGSSFGTGGHTTTTGTIQHNPSFGVVGTGTGVRRRTTFFRFLVLEAIDVKKLREEAKIVPTWKTTVTSAGSSGDLRRVFPVLVAASRAHIATDTGQKVKVRLEEGDAAVLRIKGTE